ncbi:MAG TPA: delta-60 repeat domain-containing protein, partial [Chthoniobacterales bacterium]
MKISISRGSAAAVALLILGLQASPAATPPQYIVDPAFYAPLFTARSFALRTFVLPDDRFFVVGGTSTAAIHRISGERRGSIFRFNPNGTLDNTFLLDAQLRDFSVTIAAPAPGNKVYVVCVPPTFLGGPDRLFRLNSDGSLDNSFDAGSGTTPNAAGLRRIRAILVDPSERVIVAGQFGDFSGHGHPNLLRLTSSGLLDQSFAAVALQGGSSGASLSPSSHTGIALQTDGKLIISGAFSAVNGTARHQVARLHDNGTLDTGFVPAGYTTASAITSVAVQTNGQVVLGGRLRTPSTSQSWRLFRLNTDGSRDNGFTLSPSGTTVRGIKFTTGGILVASTGSVLQKFGSNGALDSAFNANAPSFPEFPSLYSVDVQSDGRIIFAGTFQSINNEQYSGLARYDANGAIDPSFNHAAFFDRDTLPFKVASRADGKIVVTGDFEWVNGIARFGSAVLNQ